MSHRQDDSRRRSRDGGDGRGRYSGSGRHDSTPYDVRQQQGGQDGRMQGWHGQQQGQQNLGRQPAAEGPYQMQQQQYQQQYSQQQQPTGAYNNTGMSQQGMAYAAPGHAAGMQQTAPYQQNTAANPPQAAAAAAAAGSWAGYGPGGQAAPGRGGHSSRQQDYGRSDARGQQGHGLGQGRGQYSAGDGSYGGRGQGEGNVGYGGRGGGQRSGFQGDRVDRRGPEPRRDAGAGRGPYGRSNPDGFKHLVGEAEARQHMLQCLDQKQHGFKQGVPKHPSVMPALRPEHPGTLGSTVELIVNMYLLELTGEELRHYDVSFERVRPGAAAAAAAAVAPEGPAGAGASMATASTGVSGTSGSAAAAQAAAAAEQQDLRLPKEPKPPDNARDIMLKFEEQHWYGEKVCYAFDGAKNLVTPKALPLVNPEKPTSFFVDGVMMPGKERPTTWKVTFKPTGDAVNLAFLKLLRSRNMLHNRIADKDEDGLRAMLDMISKQRQMLEWVLKAMLMSRTGGVGGIRAALDMVNEVGQALYFVNNPANRNIGGGLRALAGLRSGIKLAQGGLMFAADLTSSAFLRTDINLVEWMADVAGFNHQPAAGGRGGRGGGRFDGGGGRGRGGGRALAEVGPPHVPRLLDKFWNDPRLRSKLNRAVKNKKVVYTDPRQNKSYKYQAVGFSTEPAERAFFELLPGRGNHGGVREMSVAQYFAEVLRCPLAFPKMPVVVMKLPKNCKMDKIWIPAEHCRFDKNQRVQNVTHKGGTEQMIEAARKSPQELKQAIHNAVNPTDEQQSAATAAGQQQNEDNKLLEQGFGLKLPREMQRVKGRVLPGPWLSYQAGGGLPGQRKALNTGARGSWNMCDGLAFSDPASLRSWGLLAVLPRNEYDRQDRPEHSIMWAWVQSLMTRMVELGMNLGNTNGLCEVLMGNMVWLTESSNMCELQTGLQQAKDAATRTFSRDCQLVVCFIRDKPSPLYRDIKLAAELAVADDVQMKGLGGLGLVTQVVVAAKGIDGKGRDTKFRSQYQANVCMKINAKLGGINTKWAVQVGDLLKSYFGLQAAAQAPSLMVFGIDLTHPGRVEGGRSIAAVVGSLDRELCRYGHQVWEENIAGTEQVQSEALTAAVYKLLLQHYQQIGCKPDCLVVYRDGVSDGELQAIRRLEVQAILKACAQLGGESGEYRPRVVYIVVQKRHNVRLFQAGPGSGAVQNVAVQNVAAGTIVDHTIVSPWLFDFYLNSHAAIIGTSKAARYICLLDELGFGADGLQAFTYWLCYLYCRCTRSVSVVAPVYYAHLLAFRARMLSDDGGDELLSMRSGGSGGGSNTNLPVFRQYAPELDGKMFFV